MQTSFSVGECVEFGWNEFKRNPAPYVITTLVLLVLLVAAQFAAAHLRRVGFALGFVLGPMFWVCVMSVAHKGARGVEPTLADAFRPFTERQGDYVMVALGMASGAILCGVGAVITGFLFAFSAILALEGRDFKTALIESKNLVMKYPGEVAMLLITIVVINIIGWAICGLGALIATPVSALACVKAYEQLTRPGFIADLTPPPVDPMPPAV